MANDIRLRANGVSGQLDTADLAVGTTTMTSAALADLPAVDASHHAAITLFRRNAAGRVTQQEIVWVTAHTAAATTATIVRAQEGTTAQTWNGVTTPQDYWVHADTAADYPVITTTGAPSTGAAYFKGQKAVAQDGHEYICTAVGSPGTWIEAGRSMYAPQVFVAAANISSSTTASYTTVFSTGSVTALSTTVYVAITGASSITVGGVGALIHIGNGTVNKSAGTIYPAGANEQASHATGVLFTGLTIGTAYTYTVQIELTGAATWNCRAALYPDNEQLVVTVQNV